MSLHPLEATFARLAALRADHGNWLLTRTDAQPGWLSAADLAAESSSPLPVLLRGAAAKYKSKSLRPAAMLWLGQIAYAVEVVTLACFLVEKRIPGLAPARLHFRLAPTGEVEAIAWTGRSFAALPDDPAAAHSDCTLLPHRAALREHLHRQFTGLFTPLIASLSAHSGLGKPGLWALAADYAAYAFTSLGEMLADESLGVAESRAFSAVPSKLSAKRDFIPVEHLGRVDYLLERTSCCLYYQVEGGGYCHSCPHRPLDERIELVKRHIEVEA